MPAFFRILRLVIISVLLMTLVQRSVLTSVDPIERIRQFTRQIEFDYLGWTLGVVSEKSEQTALKAADLMTENQQHDFVDRYISTIRELRQVSQELITIYSNPDVSDPDQASEKLVHRRDKISRQLEVTAPIAENILQNQVSMVLHEMRLTFVGSPLPPVLYHSTPLPLALIVSPRGIIRQDANISIIPGLTIEEIISLEIEVAKNLNVSSLVEEVGGIGTYPTMVQETDDLNWLIEVISHEWIHNYLTLKPLGLNYDTSPELRTMNETTASLAGKEIMSAVLARYYPERVPPPPPPEDYDRADEPAVEATEPPAFDFRAEMHETRIQVDQLLASGKIEEAEAYMEERRKFLWENGYQIRNLNQAYFAFHGAYADTPGGAAGNDPVGPAVRQLREQSASLSDFINRIAKLSSFEQLQQAIQ